MVFVRINWHRMEKEQMLDGVFLKIHESSLSGYFWASMKNTPVKTIDTKSLETRNHHDKSFRSLLGGDWCNFRKAFAGKCCGNPVQLRTKSFGICDHHSRDSDLAYPWDFCTGSLLIADMIWSLLTKTISHKNLLLTNKILAPLNCRLWIKILHHPRLLFIQVFFSADVFFALCEDWAGHSAFLESRFKKWSLTLPSGSHFYQVGHLAHLTLRRKGFGGRGTPLLFSLSCCLVGSNFWLDVSTDDDCVFHLFYSTKVTNMWILNAHIQRLAIPRYCSWLHHWSKKRRSYANAWTKRFDVGHKRMVLEMSRDQSRGIRWWIGVISPGWRTNPWRLS